MASPLEELVMNTECLTFLGKDGEGKVHCAITGHDIVSAYDAVKQHLASKAYKKACWYKADYSKYEPHIVAHKRYPKKLFCTLTRIALNKIPSQLEKHVAGKKFLRLKAEAERRRLAATARGIARAERQDKWREQQAATLAKSTAENDGAEMPTHDAGTTVGSGEFSGSDFDEEADRLELFRIMREDQETDELGDGDEVDSAAPDDETSRVREDDKCDTANGQRTLQEAGATTKKRRKRAPTRKLQAEERPRKRRPKA